MGYYEDLLDAVQRKLQKIHKEQKKSIDQIFRELNVTSKETIRKLTNGEDGAWQPDLQTLEELRRALQIQVPDQRYRMNLSSEAQKDLDSVADFFVRFDGYQRRVILSCCEFVDSDRKHYENNTDEKVISLSNRIPAVAEPEVHYDAQYDAAHPKSGRHSHLHEQQGKSHSRKTE